MPQRKNRNPKDLSIMQLPCSGVILAGGLNSRFSGKPKALLSVRGRRILDHIYKIFSELFNEIILVTNDPGLYLEWNLTIAADLYPIKSSLTGIHAGLFFSKNPYIFTTACDTPFLQKDLVKALLDSIDPEIDVVIPRTAMGYEPLCAVYARSCLCRAAQNLDRGRLKIQDIFNRARMKKIGENRLRRYDPDLISFFNINTPEDLVKAEEMALAPLPADEGSF